MPSFAFDSNASFYEILFTANIFKKWIAMWKSLLGYT